MIILSPTGSFSRALPVSPSDNRSVTYTISNRPPPPVLPSFVVVAPTGILNSNPPTDVQRRDAYGELIFSIVSGEKSVTGTATKAFEPGEAIDFDQDLELAEVVNTTQVSIQHNTNILNLAAMGFSDDDINEIGSQSATAFKQISDDVTRLQTTINDTKIAISKNQIAINEANKALKAVMTLNEVIGSTTDSLFESKLEAKLAELQSEKASLITQLDAYNKELLEAQDDLYKISQLVR